jgi:hypothetical protein
MGSGLTFGVLTNLARGRLLEGTCLATGKPGANLGGGIWAQLQTEDL